MSGIECDWHYAPPPLRKMLDRIARQGVDPHAIMGDLSDFMLGVGVVHQAAQRRGYHGDSLKVIGWSMKLYIDDVFKPEEGQS